MSIILPNGNRYDSVGDWFESEFGMPKEELTTEWNINYYKTLLKYTRKTHLRKKYVRELSWWQDMEVFNHFNKGIKIG
jgi:lipopolysaccharide/colanic/teichoic acid biosynthesis glycosyltransferase